MRVVQTIAFMWMMALTLLDINYNYIGKAYCHAMLAVFLLLCIMADEE